MCMVLVSLECFAATLTYDGQCQQAAGGCIPADSNCEMPLVILALLLRSPVQRATPTTVMCSASRVERRISAPFLLQLSSSLSWR